MSIDWILARRSVRKYTDQAVPDELVQTVLRAAMSAPSAGNQQPWHFVVIKDKAILKAIANVHPYGVMTAHAAGAFVICADDSLELHHGYWPQDCSAATQNLLLALNAVGLGGVWVGVYPREERMTSFRELLKIPSTIIPFALVPFGYPAETREPADRFKDDRVHHDQW